MSADSLDAPNSECIVLSIENFSSKPFIYFDLEMEYTFDSSLNLILFGLSP